MFHTKFSWLRNKFFQLFHSFLLLNKKRENNIFIHLRTLSWKDDRWDLWANIIRWWDRPIHLSVHLLNLAWLSNENIVCSWVLSDFKENFETIKESRNIPLLTLFIQFFPSSRTLRQQTKINKFEYLDFCHSFSLIFFPTKVLKIFLTQQGNGKFENLSTIMTSKSKIEKI